MSAIQINWQPTDRQLRQFGGVCLVGIPLLGWFFSGMPGPQAWSPDHTKWIGSLAAGGLAVAVAGWFIPQLLKPMFLAASVITFPIGFVLSEVVLILIYAVVFVPVAAVFKLSGRDALDRRIDREARSYWRDKPKARDAGSYFRQS